MPADIARCPPPGDFPHAAAYSLLPAMLPAFSPRHAAFAHCRCRMPLIMHAIFSAICAVFARAF